MPDSSATRPDSDRCPGVLRPYESGDGALVRLRAPGGRMSSATLRSLTECAAQYGAPMVQLTNRGNLQLRGLPTPLPAALAQVVGDLGFLPSATHEVMRNIVASPLARAGVPDLAVAYDEGLRADPDLAALSGRWLVAFDDGSGDVVSERYDLLFQERGGDGGAVFVAGAPGRGRLVANDEVVPTMLALSRAFVADRANGALSRDGKPVWNTRDLSSSASTFALLTDDGAAPRAGRRLEPGVHGADVVAGVPLGLLDVAQATAIAQVCRDVVITPWRSVLLRDAASEVERLTAAGLVTDSSSGFAKVTACVGADHCVRTTSPTLQIARTLAKQPWSQAVHVSGCDRRCGHPADGIDIIDAADTAEAEQILRVATAG